MRLQLLALGAQGLECLLRLLGGLGQARNFGLKADGRLAVERFELLAVVSSSFRLLSEASNLAQERIPFEPQGRSLMLQLLHVVAQGLPLFVRLLDGGPQALLAGLLFTLEPGLLVGQESGEAFAIGRCLFQGRIEFLFRDRRLVLLLRQLGLQCLGLFDQFLPRVFQLLRPQGLSQLFLREKRVLFTELSDFLPQQLALCKETFLGGLLLLFLLGHLALGKLQVFLERGEDSKLFSLPSALSFLFELLRAELLAQLFDARRPPDFLFLRLLESQLQLGDLPEQALLRFPLSLALVVRPGLVSLCARAELLESGIPLP